MKKTICILLIFCALLSGCSLISKEPAERSIQYAQEHIELLLSSAAEARHLAESTNTAVIVPQSETSVLLSQFSDREHGIVQESVILSDLFADGIIERIQVRESSVEFSCGGAGIGSNTTYYNLIYTESGSIEDIFWYDYRMTFEEKDGGYYGKLPDSDDTLYYYKITSNLFYFESNF